MPRRHLLPVLAGLAGSLCATAPAAAAASSPVLTVRSCTEAGLRGAVDAWTTTPRVDTIRFGCSGTIVVRTMIDVLDATNTRTLTLDGTGRDVTLAGNGALAILQISGLRQATLRRLTLTGDATTFAGSNPFGGAGVLAFSPMTVDRVTFRGLRGRRGGAAILTRSPRVSLDVSDSVFEDNSITCDGADGTFNGGGAINIGSGGPTTIRRSVFRRNVAEGICTGGGAIAAPRTFSPTATGSLTIEGSTFEGNRARINTVGEVPRGGGAIASYNRSLGITDSTFTDNVLNGGTVGLGLGIGGGGAVLSSVENDPQNGLPTRAVRIARSRFLRNGGPFTGFVRYGGALDLRDTTGETAVVEDTVFRGNTAVDGGAIMTLGALSLTGGLFEGNVASRDGGALWVLNRPVAVSTTRFIDNGPNACDAVDDAPPKLTLGAKVVERPGTSCAAVAAASAAGVIYGQPAPAP